MHLNILTNPQIELLNYIKQFKRSFYLVGGTAIALHIGHRRSIDFGLFTASRLNRYRVKSALQKVPFSQKIIFEDVDQLHWIVNQVKLTFFSYPYPVRHPVQVGKFISMPTLISLAAMKAFALGRRAKWKDYVDLYIILKDYYTISDICREAESIFGAHFSEKLFRAQLAFHRDIDFTESVAYLSEVTENRAAIMHFLTDQATEIF